MFFIVGANVLETKMTENRISISIKGEYSAKDYENSMELFYGFIESARDPFTIHTIVVDGRRPDVTERRMVTKLLRDNDDVLRRYCAGWAQTVSRPTERAIIKGISFFVFVGFEMRVFKTVDEATRWLDKRLPIA